MNENKVSRRKIFTLTGVAALGAILSFSEVSKEINHLNKIKENEEKLGSAKPSIDELRSKISDEPNGVNISKAPEDIPVYSYSPAPINYEPDENNLPITGMKSIDLSGISLGNGYGSDSIDWNIMPSYTIRIPSVNLSMPWVPKTRTYRYTTEDGVQEYDINVPVSFQAGWSIDSQPITSSRGTSFFFAHTNWADVFDSPAPMSSIKLVSIGSKVYVSDGDGNITEWIVSRKGIISKGLLDSELNVLNKEGPKRLLICTCDKDSSGEYTNNYWVEAFPVK